MPGLIPQSFIDDLLDRTDIVEVIDRRVGLKKKGKNYSACCPFHDEKTPSFSVSPEKQFYYCFGCGASGNAIGFIMDYERLDFPAAVESLAQAQGLEVPRDEQRTQSDQHNSEKQPLYQVLEQAASYYQTQLMQHANADQAQQYVRARGLDRSIVERFCMGYAPPGWRNIKDYMLEQGWSDKQLLSAGLLAENEDRSRQYDRFRQRIMFPIRDSRGRVIAFGGRVLNDDKPKYLNSPESLVFLKSRELYGLYEANRACRQLDRLIVVEGYMDVVALAQHGIDNAVATLGTAVGTAHVEKAFRYTKEIVFCFDGDQAGRTAAERALESVLSAMMPGRQVKFLFLPEGEDPDTMVTQRGKDDFLARLSLSVPLSEFLFDSVSGDLALNTAEGRATLATRAMPLLQKVPEGIYRQQLLAMLAVQTQTDSATLSDFARQGSVEQTSAQPQNAGVSAEFELDRRRSTPRPNQALESKKVDLSRAEQAVVLLLQNTALVAKADKLDGLAEVSDPDIQLLLGVVNILRVHPGASLNKIMGLWQSQFGGDLGSRLYALAAREKLVSHADIAEQRFVDMLDSLHYSHTQELSMQGLIVKAREQGLSEEEKQQLNYLVVESRRDA